MRMNILYNYEQAVMENRIEKAQNDIRALHNEIESKRIFGKKHYFSYDSRKFITLIKLMREKRKCVDPGKTISTSN